jgi:ethanolamine utilization protein EutP (predicted NTPase)
MFWFKRLSPDTFLDQLALFCRYAGLARYEIKTDEREHVIVLHHELGKKWSIFLSRIIEQVMKNTIKVIPKFDITEYSVVFRFFIPTDVL